LGSGLLLLIYNCDRKIDLGFAAKILQEADKEMTAIKFVVDGLGVALMPEQITGLSHEGTVFLPPSPRPSSAISQRLARRQSLQAAPGLHSNREAPIFVQIDRDLTTYESVVRVDHNLRDHWHLKIDERSTAE
jgi:hypothetical protein